MCTFKRCRVAAESQTARERPRSPAALLLVALAGFVLAAPSSAAVVGGCQVVTGNLEVCFNAPNKWTLIVDQITGYIDQAPAGSTIRVAMYQWTNDVSGRKVRDALLAAAQNGVTIRMALDRENAFLRVLSNEPNVTRVVCSGCLPGASNINHNKFFLFTQTRRPTGQWITNQIIQTSHNLKDPQTKRYQDMLRIGGDSGLYAAYEGFFERMMRRSWSLGGDHWSSNPSRTRLGSARSSVLYLFPRKPGGTQLHSDPVRDVLNSITQCRTGDDKIWIAISKEGDTRAEDIRDRLDVLEGMGCDVKVVASGTPSFDFWKAKVSQVGKLGVHTKILLVDAKVGGSWQRLVFTGSHIWNRNSLVDNDDTMVRIKNAGLFSRYQTHYSQLFAASAK